MFLEEAHAAAIPELYQRHAAAWEIDRGGTLLEGEWLDRLTAGLPRNARVLDVGCGNGRPIAAELIRRISEAVGELIELNGNRLRGQAVRFTPIFDSSLPVASHG